MSHLQGRYMVVVYKIHIFSKHNKNLQNQQMNHLAHFFLSNNNDDLSIGNFVADFITNKELPQYTEGVRAGIMLHREIDAFTDTHPKVKESTKRLHEYHHKYSPVIVDIYYDYLLGKNWQAFQKDPSVSLSVFTQNIYDLLKKRHNELPPSLKKRIHYMIADDWLMKYTTLEGIHEAFKRIEKAAAFPGNFGNAVQHLKEFLPQFDAEFICFFPDLMQHVDSVIASKL
jgi:acyl carrier protein phosphodiesterase